MGIRVKHSMGGSALGESAYTIGLNQKRERDAIRAEKNAQVKRQQDLQALQIASHHMTSNKNLDQHDQQAKDRLSYYKDQADVQKEQNEQRAALDAQKQAFEVKKWEEEPARKLAEGLVQQEKLKENIRWQYDEQQKREMQKLQSSIGWVRDQVSSGLWTAEQGEEAETQLWKKYHAIVPTEFYDSTPKAQELFEQSIIYGDDGSKIGYLDSKGNFQEYPRLFSVKDFLSIRDSVVNELDLAAGEEGTIDPKVVNEKTIEIMAGYRASLGLQPKNIQQPQQSEEIPHYVPDNSDYPAEVYGDKKQSQLVTPQQEEPNKDMTKNKGMNRNNPNPMLPMGGGAYAVKPDTGQQENQPADEVVTIKTKQEYDKLPAGTIYMDPTGTLRRKG